MKEPILYACLVCCLLGCDQSNPATKQSQSKAGAETTTAQTSEQVPDTEPAQATTSTKLKIIAWNIESGGNDPNVIAQELKALNAADVYCLNEVHPDNFQVYEKALGKTFDAVHSDSGFDDRLQILYSNQKFKLLESKEMHSLNDGRHRAPLYVRLQEKASQTEVVVVTNHLARGNAKYRKEQASGLREWAREMSATTALVCIGDMNMDYTFATDKGNDALPEILRDNIWKWCKPAELIDTNWDDRDGDGKDNYPGSMLDLAFVAGPAKTWNPVCRVIKRDGDFPDDRKRSDHRPIELVLSKQ